MFPRRSRQSRLRAGGFWGAFAPPRKQGGWVAARTANVPMVWGAFAPPLREASWCSELSLGGSDELARLQEETVSLVLD